MKKYNKPTIEALALETIDVIAASGAEAAADALTKGEYGLTEDQVKVISQNIVDMKKNSWSW
jgi:predicted homoserine dehydrogenase-like protein